MSQPEPQGGTTTEPIAETSAGRRRFKDFWQLHIPLVAVLALCTFATIVEYRRAQEGVDRAWAYTIQWPVIGAFAVVVWNRYRKHGSITKSISNYFRNRAARFEREAREQEGQATSGAHEVRVEPLDPEALAWQEHVRELQRHDPPGGPPTR